MTLEIINWLTEALKEVKDKTLLPRKSLCGNSQRLTINMLSV